MPLYSSTSAFHEYLQLGFGNAESDPLWSMHMNNFLMATVVGSVMLTTTLVVGEEDDGAVEGDDEDGAAVGPVGVAERWQALV